MNELISVVIPAYNVALYLKNCLESVLMQTYPSIEIIVINDGSTDSTGLIADQYQKSFPNIIRVIHTDNKGVTNARLTGIAVAAGEWIGFVDGDDEIEKDMYMRLYSNAVKYNADISHCGYMIIADNGERVHEFYNTGKILRQNRDEGLKSLLSGLFEPSLCNKLYNKSLLNYLINNNLMDKSIKYFEDLLMNYYLFRKAEKSVFEDFCSYHYLAHNSSVTRGAFSIKKVLDPVKVQRVILKSVDIEMKEIVWERYLLTCTRAYACIANNRKYDKKASLLKKELIKNRFYWNLLDRNNRIKLYMMLISPQIYSKLYHLYSAYLQKNRYE